MSETIAVIAVLAALTGAGLNAVRAWYQAPETEKFSFKKFAGGLISGGLAAVALVNFSNLDVSGPGGVVALFISNALLGVGTSTLVAKAHEG